MIRFGTVTLSSLQIWRESYFEEIIYSQELYLEWIVAKASYFIIYEDGEAAGYFIVSKNNELIEFYLKTDLLTRKEEFFSEILNQYSISTIYCKSFDSILLTCCHTFCKSSKVLGTLFRDYTLEIPVQVDDSITIRLAQQADIPHLLTYESDLYETAEELEYTVSGNMVYMFKKNEQLIGCGYLIKILPDKNYYDIGMWINPDFRHCGYASMIISYLKNYCLSQNYIPVCGCASDNIASRKTLERNGFLSKYCLLEFTV